MAPANKGVYVVPVEANVGNLSYYRALRRIRSAAIAEDIITVFFKKEDSCVFAEIKTINDKKLKKMRRVLILNENASFESVSSALNTLNAILSSREKNNNKNKELFEAIDNNRLVRFQSAY